MQFLTSRSRPPPAIHWQAGGLRAASGTTSCCHAFGRGARCGCSPGRPQSAMRTR